MKRYGPYTLWINGAWAAPRSNETLAVIEPATGAPLAEVAAAGVEDVARAVDAAHDACPAWARTPAAQRARCLERLAARLEARAAELSVLEARDSGNPIRNMRRDVERSIEFLRYFAGLAHELQGRTVPVEPGVLNYTLRQPLGVVAGIVPFNHPLLFACLKLAPALVAGNTFVLKPSEETPLSALELAALSQDLLPAGVFNVVTGLGHTAGAALAGHPRVRRISFTGGAATGREILRLAAKNMVPATLELGGKNPNVVLPDVDVETAASVALAGMNLGVQGQSCASGTRLLLHGDRHDAVVEALVKKLKGVRIGPPTDERTEMGTLVSERHLSRVQAWVRRGQADGATLVVGGSHLRQPEALAQGCFFEPTVLTDVHSRMALAQEEVFGPVLAVLRWSEPEELEQLINDTEYGLTAYVWGRDLKRALGLAERIQAGYIWVNRPGGHYPGTPFGGFKHSGLGREGTLASLLSYTEEKNVQVAID